MKVSVVIPVYNVEDYVEHCIDSVLSQTHKDFEIIVIDDCSPDRSISIVENYHSNKITIVKHDENKGLSASRNTGVKYCTGDYLLFLDSDDSLRPNALEKCLAIIKKYNSDVVSFNSRHVNESGKTWPVLWHEKFNYTDCYDIGIKNYPKLIWDVAAWNKLINLSFYREKQLSFDEDQRWFEDHLFSIQLYCNTNRVSLTNDVLHYYLKRSDTASQSITQQRSFLTSHYRFKMMESVLDYLQKSKQDTLVANFFELILSFYKHILHDAFVAADSRDDFNNMIKRFKQILAYCDTEVLKSYDLEFVDLALCIKYLKVDDVKIYFNPNFGRVSILEKLFCTEFKEKDFFLSEYERFSRFFSVKGLSQNSWLFKSLFLLSQPFFWVGYSTRYGCSHVSHFFRNNLSVYVIKKSETFDLEHYESQSVTRFTTLRFAIMHYVLFGEALGHTPNSFFNGQQYLEANLDLKKWTGNLFAHYLKHGLKKGRSSK